MLKIPKLSTVLQSSWPRLLGAVAASAILGFSALHAQAPTNNPIMAHYGPGEYPKWIDSIHWERVINMAEYTNGANHFERFENARDELHALGGGVLYYPAGEYFFDLPDMGHGPGIGPMSRGLMLKSGVIIRGADLPADANQAVVRATQDAQHPDFANDVSHNLNPQTVFVFPMHMRGTDPVTGNPNSAGQVPSHWSFIGLTTGNGEETIADVHNIGVVNVTLEGGTIYWGYHTPRAERMRDGRWFGDVWKNTPAGAPDEETWSGHRPSGEHYMHGIHGSAGWHTEMTAGSGRLVKGVRINNGAPWNDMFYVDRRTPAATQSSNDAFAHYRFTGRIAAHGSNIFVANNVIARPTKNFIHRMLQNPRSQAGNHERLVLFDFANHIGIDINKSNFGGNQDHPSAILPGGGYYFENVIVRDNWVFNRGNKNFEVAGRWVVLYNNHAEKFHIGRTFPFDYVINPEVIAGASLATGVTMEGVSFDGWDYQHQTTASDYMNRGYDMGGRNVWVHRSTLVNSGSIGNDGEGVMAQEHNRIGNFSWAFTDVMHGRANKGPGTFGEAGWHGTWNMQQFGLLLLRAWSHGNVGVFGAERASSPETGLNWVLDVSVVGGNPGLGGVTSISTAGPGPNQPVDFITTDHFNPVSAPANVTATIREDSAVHVAWEDTADNELGFRVERRVDGGDWRIMAYRPMSNLGRTIDPSITDPLDAILPEEQRTPIYRLNPQAWVDFTAPLAHANVIEYRVIAINSADDLSTGVSDIAAIGESGPFSGGPISFEGLALGAIDGQDGWVYTPGSGTPAAGIAVAEGSLEWVGADFGTIPAGEQHLFLQSGVGGNAKMNNWLAYTPVEIAGPVYVRMVAMMETRAVGVFGTDPYELFFGFTNNAAANGAPWNAYVSLKHPVVEGAVIGVEATGSNGVHANSKVVLDAPMLIVARYNVNEAGQVSGIDVWINPTAADAASPDHSFTIASPGTVLATQDHFKIRAQNMPTRIDHLYMGSSFADVVPEAGDEPPPPVQPEIAIDADSVSFELGASATLSVTVTGTAPFTFQWFKDGNLILGATGASLDLGTVSSETAGSYTVEVTNAAGTVTGGPIVVSVTEPPPPPVLELRDVFLETFDAAQSTEGSWSPVEIAALGWSVHLRLVATV